MDKTQLQATLEQQLQYYQQQVKVLKARIKRAKQYKDLDVHVKFPYELKVYRDLVQNCYRRSTKLSINRIEVCSSWRGDFLQFLVDMGDAPHDKASIIRINKYGNFDKDNCIWK